ncbi:alpha/beta fold hydrolase [Paraglaciecola sp. 20A4]|uniref:alpha/beta hydrolase n=1 Tax=Paraglaciecola sp. 20A4 TaxID=2687288 RepID=UPI00140CC72F|nr:alpha/beta fold hydrolase [Paraglaciecola sp. 20A4]
MILKQLLTAFSLLCLSFAVNASIDEGLTNFDALYQSELGDIVDCEAQFEHRYSVCSNLLKNDGNAPFILHHGYKTRKVFVLFHGLSDSPFFLTSIAQALYDEGYNVMVALLPGHGRKDADQDMQDPKLAARWHSNIQKMVAIAPSFGDALYIGGFSTGGTLAVQYVLENPGKAKGLLLFSGALALDSSVETMANIWGIKWLAKTLDGDYQSIGPNPYKYPSVARYSAFQLTDVIFSIREMMAQNQPLDLTIFAAHSEADVTTPIVGVNDLLAYNKGENTLFSIPKYLDVCHADLVVNKTQVEQINFDETQVIEILPCSIPKANPQHQEMLQALKTFVSKH